MISILEFKKIFKYLTVIVTCLAVCASIPAVASPVGFQGIPIQATPFDRKLMRTGIFDLSPESMPTTNNANAMDLFNRARAFRYTTDKNGDFWQSPAETLRKGSGDCEDKAVWLYAQLQANGYSSARLVVGKYKTIDRNFHVWVQYNTENGETWVLDAATQKRPWKLGQFSSGFYKALYSYGPLQKFQHYAS